MAWVPKAACSVFAGPGRFHRLSFGATGFVAEGRATGVDAPTMATRMLAAAPHAALNFGHRDGWSYLSIGAGMAKVRATQDGAEDQPASSGLAFHYGGGARWFVREHLAVSLDLRFWALTPRPATTARPRAARHDPHRHRRRPVVPLGARRPCPPGSRSRVVEWPD